MTKGALVGLQAQRNVLKRAKNKITDKKDQAISQSVNAGPILTLPKTAVRKSRKRTMLFGKQANNFMFNEQKNFSPKFVSSSITPKLPLDDYLQAFLQKEQKMKDDTIEITRFPLTQSQPDGRKLTFFLKENKLV